MDWFKRSSKADKPPKQAAAPKQAASPNHVAPRQAAPELASRPDADEKPTLAKHAESKCDPAKFRLLVDVGHTVQSDGAMSARNIPEFQYNLHLAQRLVDKLKSEGFAATRLLVTEGKARPSLFARVASANNWHADLLLSIHHDSVPDKMMEDWEFEGKKSHYSDRFSGYGLFVSKENPDFESSMNFAKLIGTQMRAQGIKFADQYTLPIMGKYRHDLLDRDAGIYRYDHLIVLQRTHMPAVLLEAGSIINRDEELQMASPERQDMTVNAVTTAVKQFCGLPVVSAPTPTPDAQAKADR
ncbi:MAG: N-acetylmuramoyl-L-alanine amidase [Bradyrhizobium sp.]|nr:N-acetylmuramoyl-L-alanine amidase [Bradyrhizobium sp.]